MSLESELAILREINERHYKPKGQDVYRQASEYVTFVNKHGREPSRDEMREIEARSKLMDRS